MAERRLSHEQEKLLPLTPAVFYILFTLAEGERHGYSIMQEVATMSEGRVKMGPGTLYTTIQRLLELALVEEVEGDTEADSRRRYYRLTAAGAKLFEAELERMRSVLQVVKQRKISPASAR